ncbi:GEVED domain-containing protein, partial [Flavobacterium sp.]|uniref:GEVED domain-containing protein n=1 Tax=Flavobacterium sp. TaxID=239 RepID=UPI003752FC3A
MTNNYNSLSYRSNSNLKFLEPDMVGNAPNAGKMRKSWLACIMFFIALFSLQYTTAQVGSNYSFAATTGGTINAMTGSTQIVAASLDDSASVVTPIGFSFVFNGVTYTQFSASSNGVMRLGATAATTAFSNGTATSTTSWFNATANLPFISAYYDDLATGVGGKVHYVLTGTAPNRVLFVEWFVTVPRNTTATAAAKFQVALQETTNRVVFTYGAGMVANTGNASIGLATAASGAGQMISVTASTNTASITTYNPLNSVAIPSGTTYTFSPPVPCTGTPVAGSVLPANQNVCSATVPAALVASGFSTGVSGITFQWLQSSDNVTYGPVVGGTGATTSTYTPPSFLGTLIYYKCRVTCTPSTLNADTAPVTINVPANPTTQVTAAVASAINNSGFTTSWTNGNGARRLVVISNSTITDPVNVNAAALVANTVYSGSGQQIIFDGTGSTVTVSGLLCNNTYNIKVYEYLRCGAGPFDYYYNVSTGTNAISVLTTAPSLATLPVNNNLTGFTGANLATVFPGWSEATGTAQNLNPGGTASNWTSSSVLGIPSAKINLFTISRNDWIVSPRVNLTGNSRITFKAAITEFGSAAVDLERMQLTDDKVKVLISTDGCGLVWTPLFTFEASNTTTLTNVFQSFDLNLSAYTGQTVQLAFQGTDGPVDEAPDYDFHIGDLKIQLIPNCEAPTALALSGITPTTANFSWTAAVPVPGVGYEYAITTSATPPTSGTPLAGTSGSVTGLVSGSTYYLHVRSECVATTEYSAWATSIAYVTPVVSPVPYLEPFATTALPAFWSTDFSFGTNVSVTGNPGNAIFRNLWSSTPTGLITTGNVGAVVSGMKLNFDYRTSNFGAPYAPPAAGSGTFTLAVSSNYGATYTNIETVTNDGIAGWRTKSYDLAAYVGQNIRVRITSNWVSGDFYLAFDNVSVNFPPITVASFTPSTVCSADLASTIVTLTGTNFTNATGVTLNGTSTPFTAVNDTTITVNLTAGSTAGLFAVSNVNTSGTSATGLVVNASPVVDPITGLNALCMPTVLSLSDNTPTGMWSTSNPLVATVDNAGFVTGVSAGTVIISYAVTVNGCSTTVTKSVTVSEPVVITSQPASQIVLTGNNASFSVAATGTGLTYSWEESTDSGLTFGALSNSVVFSGVSTNSLLITGSTAMMNGNEYRCVVSGTSPCSPVTSNSAVLTVGDTGIATHPANVSLCDSGSAVFNVVITGTVLGYQWYEDQGLGANPITNGGNYSGATTDTLTISGVTTVNNGYTYYVIVDGPANDPQSNTATLSVGTGVTITAQPTAQTVCYSGGSSIFSVTPAGSFTTYQWQYSTDNVNFSNVVNATPTGATYTNATTASLTVATTALTPAAGTYYYRAVVGANAPCTSVNSLGAQLLINTPVVSTQPVATSILAGNTTSFSASSVSSSPLYQWQRATTLAGTYTNVVNGTPANVTYTGATSSTLSVVTTNLAAASTANFYRVVVSSPVGCSVNSSGAQLTIVNYCASNATSIDDDDIAQVTFGTLVNPSITPSPLTANVNATGTYSDFTALPAQNFIQSTSYPIEVKQFNSDIYFTCWTKIFIDWNKDGDFADAGEAFNGVGGVDGPSTAPASGIVFSSNITVPLTASLGLTRMRVVLDENGTSTSTPLGCGTYTWGETEDYVINILPAPLCSGTPTAGTATSSSTATCANSTVNLATTGFTSGVSGLTFQWFGRDLPAGTFAPISGANSNTYTTPALTVSSEFYCTVTCTSTSLSATTNTVSVSVSNCEFNATRNTISYSSIMSTGTAYTTLSSADDGKTNTVSLAGTTFRYNGAAVTGFYATSNGWMTFNTPQTSATFTNDLTSTGQNNVLAPFWDDLVIQGNNIANKDTSMKYKIVGTLGSGTADIILEWAEMEKFTFGDPNLNFQIILHESDNSIDFNYGTMQLFSGANNGIAWSYSVGLNGTSPANATFANRAILQFENSANFATTTQNSLKSSPSCNSQIRFVPAATFTSGVAPAIIPVNNEVASAILLPVNDDACINVCGNVYSSKNATASTGIAVCSATTPGTPDDDVFFTFNTNATNTNYKISVQASNGYNAVVQVLDATLTPVACINASAVGLTEAFASITLATSTQYYLRVYDSATGVAGGTFGSGEFAICINQILPPPAYDEPAGAIALTVGTSCVSTPSISSEILRATATTGIQVCNAATAGTPDDDVWYKFTTPANATGITYNIQVQGNSTYNAVAQVFQGLPSTANSIGCANSTGNGGLEGLTGSALVSNTDYYIRVYHSGSGAANGSFSVCVFATVPSCITVPTAPVVASTVCQSTNGTTLSWPAALSATAYDVYLDNATGTTLVSADQTALTYTSSVLTAGTYSWKVVPKNAYGSATACTTFTFTVLANQVYYADIDGDGYGNNAFTIMNCVATPGYVLIGGDCNDNVASIYQSATLFIDVDADNYNNGTQIVCYGATVPT